LTLSSPPESWRLFVVTGALYAAFTTTGGGISWAVNSGSGWSAAEPVGVT
jgi:hypothetical protein